MLLDQFIFISLFYATIVSTQIGHPVFLALTWISKLPSVCVFKRYRTLEKNINIQKYSLLASKSNSLLNISGADMFVISFICYLQPSLERLSAREGAWPISIHSFDRPGDVTDTSLQKLSPGNRRTRLQSDGVSHRCVRGTSKVSAQV